jgi:PmbA protein
MKEEKDVARYALEYALKSGCQQARVMLSTGEENEVEVRDGRVDRLHHSGGCQLSLSLFVDGAYSTISTNRLERDEIERFIDKGVIGTRFLAKDPYRSLPEKEMYYRGEMNDFGLYDEDFQKIDVDEKIAVSKAIYEEIDDDRVISAMAGIADAETYNYLIDSNGFEGEKSRTIYMATAQVSVLGEGDERPEDFVYVNAQHWNRLQKGGVGAEALKRTIDKIGAGRVDSGVYDIVVDRRVASSLISPLVSALRGEALHMKSSFLLDMKGEKIGSDKMVIVDNPCQYGKAGAKLFDNEGIAVEEKYYIANIVKVVDALCLNKSDYFETYIEDKGTIYTVSKYGIYEKKTEGADIFKLDNWQQVPIFASETFKKAIELNKCTGMSFREIAVE